MKKKKPSPPPPKPKKKTTFANFSLSPRRTFGPMPPKHLPYSFWLDAPREGFTAFVQETQMKRLSRK